MPSPRRVALQTINGVSTLLTLFTGFRENSVIKFLTGQFGLVRWRLQHGAINYSTILPNLQSPTTLPDLVDVAESYTFHRAPTRTPQNLGEDRSVCLRVNSVTAPSLALHYDDQFGTGARREQVFLYSISSPFCRVLNLKPSWVTDDCIGAQFSANATACYAYILANFDALVRDRAIQVSAVNDFGVAGSPFLKCANRPLAEFKYATDHLVLQSFWAGQDYHVEIQSSQCWARPLVSDSASDVQLFSVEPVDQAASVVVAVPPLRWPLSFVPFLYGLANLFMVVRGILAALKSQRDVAYTPFEGSSTFKGSRFHLRVVRSLISAIWSSSEGADTMRFYGNRILVAANLWMNHWLYIAISIADSIVNVRTLYVILEMGSWMFAKQISLENFFFLCAALTRLTWLTCLAHTVLRHVLKIGILVILSVLKVASIDGTRLCTALDWYVDSVALFSNFKMYSVVLVVLLYFLRTVGAVLTMKQAANFKQPVYGGYPDLATMWGSEIACDLVVICSLQILAAHVIASVMILTRLRHATHNRVLLLLQQRYVFVGWDVFVAMHSLEIEPFRHVATSDDGEHTVATTHCSLAALTLQLHASGPSGWVKYAGDSALQGGTISRDGEDVLLQYPLFVAQRMGLCAIGDTSVESKDLAFKRSASTLRSTSTPLASAAIHPHEIVREPRSVVSFQDRVLHLHAESTWGAIVLVDVQHSPGHLVSSAEDERRGVGGFVVRDALHLLQQSERRALLLGTLKLQVC